jgi:protein-S-isoprenylcysteine O-methyltransferase Ste14
MSIIPEFEIGVWNAWLFMSVFIIQTFAVMFLGRRVWERSGLPSGIKRNRLEKQASIVGNAVWFIATIYSIFLPLQLCTIWFFIGLPIFLIGLFILIVATANFAIVQNDKPATGGAYRFSRHPLYLSLVIVYLGTSIASASWVFLLLGIANIFWIRLEVSVEERYCIKRYGNDYQSYMDRTPRWMGIPKS